MVGRRVVGLLLLCSLLPAVAGCTKAKNSAPNTTVGAPAAVGSAQAGTVLTPQQVAAEPGGLETVRVAYNLLLDLFYKPVKSNTLLQSAWGGVVQQAVRQGGSDNGNAPKLTGDRDADFKAFSASFNSMTAGKDPSQYAYAAVDAMVQTVGDDHTYFLSPQEYRQRQGDFLANGNQSIFSARMLPNNIGYMKLSIFPAGYAKLPDGKILGDELDSTLNNFEAQGVKGWILDLRGDPGGHTESIATVAGRFIPQGVVGVSLDAKQQRMELPVDGHYFPHQHPLAVLINGQSGSASEITAEALKEYGVARLIGTKTAGSVNGAEEFPLPGQVGLQVTVVEALSGKTEKPLDKVGVQPDEAVTQQSGQDSQLAAAQAWLTGASASVAAPVGTPAPATGVLPDNQIRSQLSPLGAKLSDIPTLPNLSELGDLVEDTPNEYVQCAPHALPLAQTVIQRGWQGEYDQFFGSGDPYTYQVTIDLYKDANGAQQAIRTNDFPTEFQNANVPVRIGDETVAQKGIVSSLGETRLEWRRGRVVFSALYLSVPGAESFDPLVQIAKDIDTRYQQTPIK